jgi:hypothetical protein
MGCSYHDQQSNAQHSTAQHSTACAQVNNDHHQTRHHPSPITHHTLAPEQPPGMKFWIDELPVLFPYPHVYPEQVAYMRDIKRTLDCATQVCVCVCVCGRMRLCVSMGVFGQRRSPHWAFGCHPATPQLTPSPALPRHRAIACWKCPRARARPSPSSPSSSLTSSSTLRLSQGERPRRDTRSPPLDA